MRHTWDASMFIGYLYPTFRQEVVPLDTWWGNITQLGRMSPMNKPVFGNFMLDTYFFFVPHRLTWNSQFASIDDDFGDVITEKDSSPDWPTMLMSQYKGQGAVLLPSAFGCGVKNVTGDSNYSINALPIIAYNLIYNEFFAEDQFAQTVVPDTNQTLKQINYKKADYLIRVRTMLNKDRP